MTLNEFIDAVQAGELSDQSVLTRWGALCEKLRAFDAGQIRDMIAEEALIGLAAIENNDGFGTEGMTL